MGGRFDALMMQAQAQQQAQGSYSGTAVPNVGGYSPHGYTPPANWANPTVSGGDLMVHRDVLRSVASQVDSLAATLDAAVSACQQGAVASTAHPAGQWEAAAHVNNAMQNAYRGIT